MRKIVRNATITLLLMFVLLANTGFAETEMDVTLITMVRESTEEQTETTVAASLEQTNLVERISHQKKLFEEQMAKERIKQEELLKEQEELLKQSELDAIISACGVYCDTSEIYFIDTEAQYTDEEKQLLAQCLFCEAGGTSWECQVITLSAILNHCDTYDGLWVLDNVGHFEVAPYYRYCTPQEEQYEVVEYVLSGHRIADVQYFRTQYYHSFGTNMLNIDNVYFSK